MTSLTAPPPALDVRQIFRTRFPRAAKRVPGFAVDALRRMLHEDELNYFFGKEAHKPAPEFVAACLEHLDVKTRPVGLEKALSVDAPMFACNHPTGIVDGLMMIDVLWPHFGHCQVLVNDLLMAVQPLKGVFLPVNKFEGRLQRSYVDELHAAFEDPKPMVVFPAGEVSKQNRGVISDVEWKKLFIQKARKIGRPIIPVYIHTRTSPRFHRVSRARRFLKVKFPLEMILLADEMGYQSGRTIDVVFGDPIEPSRLTDDKSPQAWAQWVKDQVYSLSEGLDPLVAEPRSARYQGWKS